MTGAETALIVLGALLLLALVLLNLAHRVDRLHRRVVRSRAVLESQLVHRAEAAAHVAAGGSLDPASAIIVGEIAWTAAVRAPRLVVEDIDSSDLAPPQAERARVESDLTRSLRTALGPRVSSVTAPGDGEATADPTLERLEQACYRVQLARRFHNDAVTSTATVRATPLVRMFRLAGRTPMPETFEMDDQVFDGPPTSRPPVPDEGLRGP